MKHQVRLIKLLMHPVSLSLMVTVIIVLLFIPTPAKYKLQIEDETTTHKTTLICYDDLDGNGFSDKICAQDYASENQVASLLIWYNPGLFFNEWDFPGSFSFGQKSFIKTGDYDNDGKKEVYLLSIRSDSVFLNIIRNPKSKTAGITTRFITTVTFWNGKPNLNVYMADLADMNGDSFGDLVFSVNSGFSAEPRGLYVYDIRHDSLGVSPKKGYFGRPEIVRDINGDGFPEIILNGYACQNVLDTIANPVHDRCCWLIVYDHNLIYLFPPKKFPAIGYSVLTSVVFPGKPGPYDLFSCYCPPASPGATVQLYHLDHHGLTLRTCSIPGILSEGGGNFFPFRQGGSNYMAISASRREIDCFDTSLGLTRRITIKPGMFTQPFNLDIDADGKHEILSLDAERHLLTVFRPDLTDPAILRLPDEEWSGSQMSVVESPDAGRLLSLFNGKKELMLSYTYNPFYYSRWGVYAVIFLSIYLFTILVGRIQRSQLLKQQQTEKKITELQLKIVRNQMDPHFTLNAINSVVDAINREEKEEARENLLHFSKMYRSLVLSADKIKRSLREEIDFTENYLALERFRFGQRFSYYIRINPDVELTWEVPKMVIQSPVENAVKHGLLDKACGGVIEIHARHEDHKLILEITDNGAGRESSALAGKTSTGKGMEIMEQFFGLYYKITGTRVQSKVFDLQDEAGNASGTKVIVTIPLS